MSLIDDSKLENSERNIDDSISHHFSYYDDVVHLEEEALELSANLREKNGDIKDINDYIPKRRHSSRWRSFTENHTDRVNELSYVDTINESGDIIQCPFRSRYEYISIDKTTLTTGTFILEEDTDLDIVKSPELLTLINYADALGLLEDVKNGNSVTILEICERVSEYGLKYDKTGLPVDEIPVVMVEETIYGNSI